MRQHLALDALAGAALCGAGLLMRRQPAGPRALLVAVGLSELAVAALSSAKPVSGPGQGAWADRMANRTKSPAANAGYPPLDTPKPVAPGVFIVDSLLPGLVGRIVPARMTVIRLPDGGLLLHSPPGSAWLSSRSLRR